MASNHLLNGRLSRRRFLAWAGATLAAQLPFARGLEGPTKKSIRLGVVLPLRNSLQRTIITDPIAEAARMGAVMGGGNLAVRAQELGFRLDVLLANAPDEDAAFHAAQRLIATEEVCALIGGVGPRQAEVLNQVAEEREVIFFNIGSTSDALREQACSRYTFHVEASAAMYLDALAGLFIHSGHLRWFFVYANSHEGQALYRRATKAIKKGHPEASEVGRVDVTSGQLVYNQEFDAIRNANPDVVCLLMEAESQANFLLQYGISGLDFPIAAFPDPISQSRYFLALSSSGSPGVRASRRVALWETTLNAYGTQDLNERFISQWGEPMDPSAWAAYHSVKMLFEASISTGTQEPSELIDFLESPEAVFDLHKGPGTSFNPWNHQLRQPLYLVEVNSEAEWGFSALKKVEVAHLVGELPTFYARDIPRDDQLNMLGDDPSESSCRF